MKLAIIMSGMLRNFEHTFFATKKFLLEDDFFDKKDIFFYGYADNLELDDGDQGNDLDGRVGSTFFLVPLGQCRKQLLGTI